MDAPVDAALDARTEGAAVDAGDPDRADAARPTLASLQTFMSFGGNPAALVPGGQCFFAAGNIGETPTLEPCAPQTPPVTVGYLGQQGAGEIRIAGLCLQAPAGEVAGNTTLEPCDGGPAQSWGFEAGRIVSDPGDGAATRCLTDSGGDNPDNVALGEGNCGTDPTGRNLWMPVGLPIALETADATHAWCLGVPWRYEVTFPRGKTTYSWIDLADDRALEIRGGVIDAGAGAVDLAAVSGVPWQIWGFATEAATPDMTVLFESNLHQGGSCLGVGSDDPDAGMQLEALPCDGDGGPGDDPAQLWYPTLIGFPPGR